LGRDEMYGLQYSVLPRKRLGLAETWKILNDGQESSSSGKKENGSAGGHQNGGANGRLSMRAMVGKRWK
jgi:hypothetical protein